MTHGFGKTPRFATAVMGALLLSSCVGISSGGSSSGDAFVLATTDYRSYSNNTSPVLNPERGFYRHTNLLTTTDFAPVRNAGHSLAYTHVSLADYRSAPIPESVLDAINAGFAAARAAGIKTIPRFRYNADSGGEDASLAWILHHIEQLTPLLQDNQDVIYTLQAGFVGAWGEWHSSSNDHDQNPEALERIVAALLAAVPEERMIQVRTPMFKQAVVGTVLLPDEAFSQTPAARVGHHNDCFLASETDRGTYPGSAVAQWKAVVAQEARAVPVGGETCRVSERTVCAVALAEMQQLGYSYLNRGYHPDVLAHWESPEGDCIHTIERKLGYRFTLLGAGLPRAVRPGGRFQLSVQLYNEGWAPLYNPRPLLLVLSNGEEDFELALDGVDVRRWQPGQSTSINAVLQLPADLPEGRYELSLWLPDASPGLRERNEYALRLSNPHAWRQERGYNVLAELEVREDAAGDRDASAAQFSVVK